MANKQKANIPMRLACVLLCLTIFTLHLTSGLYARYTSNGAGDDLAGVAKFHVIATGSPADVTVTPDENGTYTITVQNQSEVAISYTVTAEISGNPTWITPKLDGAAQATGTLSAGAAQSATHTLSFEINWGQFTASSTGATETEELTFTVSVSAQQID